MVWPKLFIIFYKRRLNDANYDIIFLSNQIYEA